MKTITVLNQKGGCAKTSTCLAIISGLTHKGFKVLAVDSDPQGNLTYSLGARKGTMSLLDVFNRENVRLCIHSTKYSGCDIIPSSPGLASADLNYTGIGKEDILRNALEKVSGYDYAVIDNPPHLGILSTNSLTAADELVIPSTAEVYSLQGIADLSRNIDVIREYKNPNLRIAGILITKYNGRLALTKSLEETLKGYADKMGTKVFNARIRESVAISEAQLQQTDILTYNAKNKAIQDYRAFVEELLG